MAVPNLVKGLDIQSEEELERLMEGSSEKVKAGLRLVIFKGTTYKEAGERVGMSHQHIYDAISRLSHKKLKEEKNG